MANRPIHVLIVGEHDGVDWIERSQGQVFASYTAGRLDGGPVEGDEGPDAALVDLDIDGAADLTSLRELHRRVPHLPIVAVTSYPSVETAVECFRLNVVRYLIRPVTTEVLLEALACTRNLIDLKEHANSTRRELDSWTSAMVSALADETARTAAATPKRLIATTAVNIARSLKDLVRMAGVPGDETDEDVCMRFNCPRHLECGAVLKETIRVIEETKHSFRSRELGVLRDKLENFVRRWEQRG